MTTFTDAVAALSIAPRGWWRHGEASGTTMVDASGNGRHGTYMNNPARGAGLLTGDPDTAVYLNGVNQYGTVPYGSWMHSPTALSLVAVVRTTASTGERNLISRDTGGDPERFYRFMVKDGRPAFYGGSTMVQAPTSAAMADGATHLLVATVSSAGTCRLYVDGALVHAQGLLTTLTATDTARELNLGVDNAGAGWYAGALDETMMFGGTLTDADVAALWEGVTGGRSVIVADNFNRPSTSGPLGSTSTGAVPWTAWSGFWGISSGRAYTSGGASSLSICFAVVETGVADCTVEVVIAENVNNAQQGGLMLRGVSLGNGLVLESGYWSANGTAKLYRGVGGTYTIIGQSAGAQAFLTGDRIRVEMTGSTITVFQNGTQIITATDTTYATATKHGMYVVNGGNSITPAAFYFDAFSVLADVATPTVTLGGPVTLRRLTVTGGLTADPAPVSLGGAASLRRLGASGGLFVLTDAAVGGSVALRRLQTSGGLHITGGASLGGTVTLPRLGTSGGLTSSLAASAVRDNRVGGRTRLGVGRATFTPAVVPPPPGVDTGYQFATASAFGPHTMAGTLPVYDTQTVSAYRYAYRITAAGRDITYFRDVHTPLPGYTLVEPLRYGPLTLVLPQVAGHHETLGEGDLAFIRPGAVVTVDYLDPLTRQVVIPRHYVGVMVSFDVEGRGAVIQCGGEASGRAALIDRQVPLVDRRHDLGFYAYRAIRELGLPFSPRGGPKTGIPIRNFGGMKHLEYLNQIHATAWKRNGTQWTTMPGPDGVYRMAPKDTTTIHGTLYPDDTRNTGTLTRDIAEEPNRVFVTGVTPEGMRVRFGSYPGMRQTDPPDYPMAGNAPFGEGTTNADTVNGDGVRILINRLRITKYLDGEDVPGGFDADVTRAVRDLQEDAGLPETGVVNPKTWRALYDLSATGFSLRFSKILPAAEDTRVRKWRRSGSGAIMTRNPRYNRKVLPVDLTVDMGLGYQRRQMREWAKAELVQTPNWTGRLTLNQHAYVSGLHSHGDPLTPDRLRHAVTLQPGMNLWVWSQGGLAVHVSAVQITAGSGVVSADVDTRARDAMKVWAIQDRNRENRRSPARAFIESHRSSTETKDVAVFDENGGILGDDVKVRGLRWVVMPIVAGQSGTIQALRLRTDPHAESVAAIFGRRIYPGTLRKKVGNPLTVEGTKRWENEQVLDALDARYLLLYKAGDHEAPLGWYPKDKGDEDAVLTGRWRDEAGIQYRTFREPVLWLAVFTDRDTTIPAGRLMWPQQEHGA